MLPSHFAPSKAFAHRRAVVAGVLVTACSAGAWPSGSRRRAASPEMRSPSPRNPRRHGRDCSSSGTVPASAPARRAPRPASPAGSRRARLRLRSTTRPATARASRPAGPARRRAGERYDVILIMAGGNDVMHFTLEGTLREDIDRVALQAKAMAPLVVIMPAGNVGNAPFFLPPCVMGDDLPRPHAARGGARRGGPARARLRGLYKSREHDPFVTNRTAKRGRRAASERPATAFGCTSFSRNPRSPPCSRWDTSPACLFLFRRAGPQRDRVAQGLHGQQAVLPAPADGVAHHVKRPGCEVQRKRVLRILRS